MKRKVLIIIIAMSVVFVGILTAAGVILYKQYLEKQDGNIYVIISQYDVKDGNILSDRLNMVLLEELFSDKLVYNEKIETTFGYNVVEIKNGIIKVIESDCPQPYSLNGCMHHSLNNKKDNIFSQNTIICMQHGLYIKLEVRK